MTNAFRVNWPQAAGEALLIFIGVMAALAGQAWWENRVEARLVAEHLANIRDELAGNLEELPRAADVNRADADRAATLSRLLVGDPPSSQVDSIRFLTTRLYAYAYVIPRTAALTNLLQSGELGAIPDQDLRILISRYDQALGRYRDYGQDMTRFQTTVMEPALRRSVNLVGIGYGAMLSASGYELGQSRYEFDPGALRTTEFENLIFGRLAYDLEAAELLDEAIQAAELLMARLGN